VYPNRHPFYVSSCENKPSVFIESTFHIQELSQVFINLFHDGPPFVPHCRNQFPSPVKFPVVAMQLIIQVMFLLLYISVFIIFPVGTLLSALRIFSVYTLLIDYVIFVIYLHCHQGAVF